MRNSESKRSHWRRGRLVLAVIGCALGITLMPGCTSMTGEKKKPADPILGEVHPQNTNPYGPAPPPPKGANETTGHKMSSVPPPPDPLIAPSPNSPAYLASRTKPLAGAAGLAIKDDAQQVENTMPVVRPVPRDSAFVNNSWVQAPGSPSPNVGSGTSTPGPFNAQPGNYVDPQTELLKSRGITEAPRIIPQPDGTVRLLAIAPRRDDPSQVQTFDVTARDYPAAVQALILQLEQVK